MKKVKHVLICEQSDSKLKPVDDKEKYVFEGIFTKFGVENNNGRIYEEREFLTHLEYLQKKIEKNMLVGELDHPEKFDIQFSNASHVIEKLEYDKSQRAIVGKIRLLNTRKGQDAKALVDEGVQLSISSRAAGTVDENKKVHLNRVFTYDLVNDPGFEQANLNRVTESLGFSDNSNIQIYEFIDTLNDENEKYLNNIDMNNNKIIVESNEDSNYITKKDLENVVEKFNNVISAKDEEIKTLSEKIENNAAYFINELNESGEFATALSEHINNLINFGNDNSEKFEQIKAYANLLADKMNKVARKTNEYSTKIENLEDYSNCIMEKVETTTAFSNTIADYSENIMNKVESSVLFTNSVAEYTENIMNKVSESVRYTEQIAENANKLTEHQDHFAKNANVLVSYTKYLKTKLQEQINLIEDKLGYSIPTQNIENKNNILAKIDELLDSTNKKEVVDMFEKYYNLLSTNTKNEFSLLQKNEREKVIEAIKNSKPLTEREFIDIWQNALKPVDVKQVVEHIISEMPEEYKPIWETLDIELKTKIINQSAFYNLSDSYAIKNFWETRKELNEAKDLILLNKSDNNLIVESNNNNKNTFSDPYVAYVAQVLSRKF